MKRTLSCNGTWNMKIHSPEYYNSLEDYEITIKNGYLFEKGDLFSAFVDDLYKLRVSYPKGDPMNLTCKLIMNSLFGRFAMKPITTTQSFMSRKDFYKLTENTNYEIDDFLDLGDLGFFVSYSDLPNKKDHNISIGIASAVTAYGRVAMSILKKNNNFQILYSDTDSVFIIGDLPSELIGNELGKFKLEYIFKEVVMLGPKLYMGVTTDDKIIAKVKGYKNANKINFDDFKSLLNKNITSLDLDHGKWFRELTQQSITVKSQIYRLMITENKIKWFSY